MYLLNTLFVICLISLAVIIFLIFYYRGKNAENNLIQADASKQFAKNEESVEA